MTAHIGHWSTSLLYVTPVVVLVGFLVVQSRRERRRAAREDEGPAPRD